jgi:hypothetical protein
MDESSTEDHHSTGFPNSRDARGWLQTWDCSTCWEPYTRCTCGACSYQYEGHGDVVETVTFLKKQGWINVDGPTLTAPMGWRCPKCARTASRKVP